MKINSRKKQCKYLRKYAPIPCTNTMGLAALILVYGILALAEEERREGVEEDFRAGL